MTFLEFHNALRVLLNVDFDHFADALEGVKVEGDPPAVTQWPRFRESPWRWFIAAPTRQAEAVWRIVEERLAHAQDRPAGDLPGHS